MLGLKAIAIEGIQTGTLAQAREVLDLLRAGQVPSIQIAERPLAEAQAALDDLRAGRVVGRVSLAP
jgi:alcohol dehydrogenase, propanol-preferring